MWGRHSILDIRENIQNLGSVFQSRRCRNFYQIRLAGYKFCSMYRSSFHGKKVPKTNIFVHLLTCCFLLKDS